MLQNLKRGYVSNLAGNSSFGNGPPVDGVLPYKGTFLISVHPKNISRTRLFSFESETIERQYSSVKAYTGVGLQIVQET